MAIAFYLLLVLFSVEYVGLHRYLPFLKPLHFSTILSIVLFIYVLIQKGFKEILNFKESKLLLAFVIFTFATMSYAIVSIRAYQEFRAHLAYLILFVICFYLVDNIKKLNNFLMFFIACHDIIVLVNLKNFSGMARHGGFKAGYFFGDGNDFAWALIIVLPFTIYIFRAYRKYVIKAFGVFSFGLLVFGILGTASRGAFIAFVLSMAYLGLNSKKKVLFLLLMGFLLFFAVISAAPGYFERMEGIKNFSQDSSAQGRLIAWKSAIHMAIDYPLGVGGGNFASAYGRFYRDRFSDTSLWASQRWISPHSIYFSILAEYGILGLLLLLYLLYNSFRDNIVLKNIIILRNDQPILPEYLLIFVNMSLLGYSVAGFFLGGINYPHLYVICFIIIRTKSFFYDYLNIKPHPKALQEYYRTLSQ